MDEMIIGHLVEFTNPLFDRNEGHLHTFIVVRETLQWFLNLMYDSFIFHFQWNISLLHINELTITAKALE